MAITMPVTIHLLYPIEMYLYGELCYDSGDPIVVTLRVLVPNSDGNDWQSYAFDRDLFITGVQRTVQLGDTKMWPSFAHGVIVFWTTGVDDDNRLTWAKYAIAHVAVRRFINKMLRHAPTRWQDALLEQSIHETIMKILETTS